MKIKPSHLTILLAVSLVANVALASLLLVGSALLSRPPSAKAVPAPGAQNEADVRRHYEHIASLPITDEQKKRLLLADLQERYRGLTEAEADVAYWRPTAPAAAAHAIPERIRTDLVAIFGPRAAQDPLFAGYFRPLDTQMPFLAPEKQVAVANVLASARIESQRLTQAEEPHNHPQILQQVQLESEAKLRAILTPEEYTEFELRNSPLADSLRRLNLDLNEDTYRKLFTQINAEALLKGILTRTIAGNRPSSKVYSGAIAELLGREKYLRFLRQVDPLYFVMAGVARDQRIASDVVIAAYEKTVASQEMMRELDRKGDQAAVRAELSRQGEQLSGVFGPGFGMMLVGMIEGSLKT